MTYTTFSEGVKHRQLTAIKGYCYQNVNGFLRGSLLLKSNA